MCLSHFHHVSFYLFFCKIIKNRQHLSCNHHRPKSCVCSLSGWKLRTPSPLLGCAGHGQGQYHQHQHGQGHQHQHQHFHQGPDHHHYHDYFDHQIKSTIKQARHKEENGCRPSELPTGEDQFVSLVIFLDCDRNPDGFDWLKLIGGLLKF